FDFGFNKFVGKKFPNKEWPQTHWDELGKMLSGRFSFSVQRHLDDLTGYIEWIDSCRALITCDSLGLHIGLALEKRVILLIGPSSSAEIPGNGNLRVLKPHPPGDCSPCCLPECGRDDPCMKYISPLAVFEVLKEWADRGAGGDRC
ncbi:MAG: hypothetical protein FJ088_01230, partial [Deltaproteobacteria bacterium]|nr:hypothetical protein [Deltaproteobacteria bacterium]